MPERYVPPLRFRVLTAVYDPFLALTLRERRWKQRLVEQAAVAPGHRVLDLGCGTATLTIMLAQACPGASVVGLDGDPDALSRAQEKARRAGVEIELVQGLAAEPPLPPRSFDRVVSSLFFHHLTNEGKLGALRAAGELLKPGGELHVADFGRAQDVLMRIAFLPVQLLDGFSNTRGNVNGELPVLIERAGFVDVRETRRERTVWGTLALLRAAWSGGGAS